MATRAKGKPGRPRLPSTAEQHKAALDKARDQVADRHRSDCKRLADAIKACHDMPDYGAAAAGSPAAALGTLARATQTLHDLERQAFDFGKAGAGKVAVFIMPAPIKSIEAWARSAGQEIPEAKTTAPDPDEGRHIEASVQGEAPADWSEPEEPTG